jgi:ribosomal protein L28
MQATIRNRNNGKSAKVLVKVSDKGLRTISSGQYNNALAKLGHGPVAADMSLLVVTASGCESAAVEQA